MAGRKLARERERDPRHGWCRHEWQSQKCVVTKKSLAKGGRGTHGDGWDDEAAKHESLTCREVCMPSPIYRFDGAEFLGTTPTAAAANGAFVTALKGA